MQTPIIAITMGDAAGIGPELIVKVLADEQVYSLCRPIVIGDLAVMEQIAAVLDSGPRFRAVEAVANARFVPGIVDVLSPEDLTIGEVTWGALDPELGRAAGLCLQTAMELGQTGAVQGAVFAPMNKEAFHLGGYDYRDELEFLADLTNSEDTYIAGLVGSLWTATVSEHVSLSEAVATVRRDPVLRSIRRLDNLLDGVGRGEATIAVAALNPHGGEGGLFGTEEIEEIEPAVRLAQQDDIDARGPYPADTVFITAQAEGYDAVLCMYHDQANIARKLLATWDGATVFMGLPIPCATTAHGTAFDKAGQGVSNPGSLRVALECVAALAGQGQTMYP
jgi:4-hydroxy-L-threonine phosphate dehydrogenase PdxA